MSDSLALVETVNDEYAARIKAGIREYNNVVSPPHRALRTPGAVTPLQCYLMDTAGALRGGITAEIYWDWLNIDDLWLAEAMHGQDWGTRLLTHVKMLARRHGCTRPIEHIQLPGARLLREARLSRRRHVGGLPTRRGVLLDAQGLRVSGGARWFLAIVDAAVKNGHWAEVFALPDYAIARRHLGEVVAKSVRSTTGCLTVETGRSR